MSVVFADTAYYVAVLLENDALHDPAVAFDAELPVQPTITTDTVLVEVLAYFSKRGRDARLVAVKGYSLTDCMSMVVCLCLEQDITDVLTHDRHFEQEGFAILL